MVQNGSTITELNYDYWDTEVTYNAPPRGGTSDDYGFK